ncbi:MAG: polysaccharide biosynthesis C-terminal domain-containing protein, partial [Proteobacteria bacterium]|nr:polysaccharide biosynthesis C-terminal domain-containing protein [Pseudomonadota bacterium]
VDAYGVLVCLICASAISMGIFALEPAMYAVGRPDIPLRIKFTVSLIHIAATVILLQRYELIGAGFATVLTSTMTAILMTLLALRLFRGN